ncbi:MAG: TolC family protein [Thermoguttaceae bacterium]
MAARAGDRCGRLAILADSTSKMAGVPILPSMTSAAEDKGESSDDLKTQILQKERIEAWQVELIRMGSQIKALQKDRIEALTRLVDVCWSQYRAGSNTFSTVVGAHDQLLSAQLDFTEKPEERVALLTNQAKTATEYLELTQGRFKTGITTQADIYRAQSHLLDIKINLLRERNRHPPK